MKNDFREAIKHADSPAAAVKTMRFNATMNCEDYIYWCFTDAGLVDATDLRRLFRWQDTCALSGSSPDWGVIPLGITLRRNWDGAEREGDLVFFESRKTQGFSHVGILTLSAQGREVRHLWSKCINGVTFDSASQDSVDLLVTAAQLRATYVPFALVYKVLQKHLEFCAKDAPAGLSPNAFWALFRIAPRDWFTRKGATLV